MTSVPMQFLDRIRIDFLALSLIAGLIMMFCTPLRLIAPPWMIFPFSGNSALEVLYRLSVILPCSICLGVPIWFLKTIILGDHGLNHILHAWACVCSNDEKQTDKREKKKEKGWLPVTAEDYPYFVEWIRNRGIGALVDSNLFEYAIISGAICAGELALLLNLIPTLVVASLALLDIPTYSFIEIVSWFILMPLAISFLFWLYDKRHFRDRFNQFWDSLQEGFRNYQEE